MSDNALSLDNQVCFPLYAASHLMTRLYRPLLDQIGLTYPQYLVLLVLWEQSHACSVGDICQRLHLDSGTITPLLKRLESNGLISRTRSPQDERRVFVSLTPQGQQLQQQAAHIPNTLSCQLGLSAQELSQLRTQLHDLLNKLQA
jgi:MarR family transcriptional regulator, organic hydroperoxide resistance regulator